MRSPEARLIFAFTEHDTAPLRRRITRDLALIARCAHAADSDLRALILTGGFSRGEGTARDDAPINDYDLVAVRRVPGRARYPDLVRSLTNDIGLEVDLKPVWAARLPYVGRKLFWLDTRLGGRVISGDPSVLSTIRALSPADLAPAETARLLGNRAAGMLLSLPEPGAPPEPRQRDLQAAKAVIAAMDATLLSRGLYAAPLRERLALSRDHPDHATFQRAVEWKLGADAALPEGWWSEARDVLLRAVEATRARDARDGLAEHALHALRARRLAYAPSQRVRHAAWDLLATSTWPEGPAAVGDWGALKRSFFAARAHTLQ